MLKDILQDILKYTNIGLFTNVKIEGNETETNILASDGIPALILNAKTKEPIPELEGVFGFNNLTYLKGLMNFESFKKDNSTISVKLRERNGKEFPELIEFTNDKDGAGATYRLTHESAIPAIPTFKGISEWDVVFKPNKEKIEEFAQLAALHADMEEYFLAKTVGNDLVFYIGEESAATHKAYFVFERAVQGELDAVLKWPINHTLSVLRLSQSGDAVVRITKKGVINICIDSGLIVYDFFIVPNQK